LPEVGAGPQVGEGADVRVRTDHGAHGVGADHLGAGADLGVGQGGVRTDQRVLADVGGAVQLDAGQDHRVLGDRDVGIDPRGGGVDDGDPGAHVSLEDATIHLGAELGELDAVVDALDHHHVVGHTRVHGAPVATGD